MGSQSSTTIMRRILLLVLGILISGTLQAPAPPAIDNDEDVADLFSELFREGRDLDGGATEVTDNNVATTNESDKVVTDKEEISKYNNYMDAVYRRMNAALRAKLMDPMQLNLDSKSKKHNKKSKKLKKEHRDARAMDVDEETDEVVESDASEDEVDRVGKAKKEGKKKSGKGRKGGKGKKGGKRKDKDEGVEKQTKEERQAAKAARKAEK